MFDPVLFIIFLIIQGSLQLLINYCLFRIFEFVIVGKCHEAEGACKKVYRQYPFDKGFGLIGKTQWSQEETEETFAPVVIEEAEVIHYLMHAHLRQYDDQPEEKVVEINYSFVNGWGVNRREPQNGYDNEPYSATKEHKTSYIK